MNVRDVAHLLRVRWLLAVIIIVLCMLGTGVWTLFFNEQSGMRYAYTTSAALLISPLVEPTDENSAPYTEARDAASDLAECMRLRAQELSGRSVEESKVGVAVDADSVRVINIAIKGDDAAGIDEIMDALLAYAVDVQDELLPGVQQSLVYRMDATPIHLPLTTLAKNMIVAVVFGFALTLVIIVFMGNLKRERSECEDKR